MKTYSIVLILILACGNVFAETHGGAHHEPSIADLKWPFVNFFILFGALGFLIKGKIAQMFNGHADEIEKMVNFAQEKDREAQIKLEMFQKKMDSIEQQKLKITQEVNEDIEKYSKNLQQEVKSEMARIQRESENKLESEKKVILSEINEEVLGLVIDQTKKKISGNSQNKTRATEKLLAVIQ